MQIYHLIWLQEHPHRTQEWLVEKLAEGFDIHHIDGDHSNNSPLNLVLIDGADHMMLHNTKKRMFRGQNNKQALERNRQEKIDSIGMYAHKELSYGDTSWREIAKELGVSIRTAKMYAELYASQL